MSFWSDLFSGKPKLTFKGVDWLAVDGKLRSLEQMAALTDQVNAKQLLIQGDMLVDSIMKEAAIPGQTMGERLKNLKEKMTRTTYNRLWQAHIKRNELVHDHGSFVADWEKAQHFTSFKEAISAMKGIR